MALATQVCIVLSIWATVTVGPGFSIPLLLWSLRCPGVSSPEGILETLLSKPHVLVFHWKYSVTEAVSGCYPRTSGGGTECQDYWWNPANGKRQWWWEVYLACSYSLHQVLVRENSMIPHKVCYAECYGGCLTDSSLRQWVDAGSGGDRAAPGAWRLPFPAVSLPLAASASCAPFPSAGYSPLWEGCSCYVQEASESSASFQDQSNNLVDLKSKEIKFNLKLHELSPPTRSPGAYPPPLLGAGPSRGTAGGRALPVTTRAWVQPVGSRLPQDLGS